MAGFYLPVLVLQVERGSDDHDPIERLVGEFGLKCRQAEGSLIVNRLGVPFEQGCKADATVGSPFRLSTRASRGREAQVVAAL